ncbi:WAT1-related protein At2g37460-like [Juglans microcarpa x Juglans regia]|uniref:WAT1-related protein At2g37460-like n=1 Tax=Juglans microcarpa x Juglans regia TaxID=2249226 RepID=UPI001B7E2B6C|nr:WAT1-related protein At2g37460-like [Juglans microcarpa x Juglans regia]
METTRLLYWLEESKAYVFLTLNELCLAIFMILVQSLTSVGVSALIIQVYGHAISTIVLALLAFFIDKITLCQILLAVSLQYLSSTYQSVGLNLVPSIVFTLALIFRQEKIKCWSINGQAKIWGLALSAAGALTLVLWDGPVVLTSMLFNIQVISDGIIGGIMIVVGVLSTSFWNIVVGHVTRLYPAELSLTAMMSLFGTIQAAIVAAFVSSSSSWKLKWEGGLVLITILLGGVVVTGLSYYVMTWSIKKRGPVFTTAFNPLLVVLSFLLQTFVLGNSAHLGSIVGGVLVILGLYLLLWAKANDMKKEEIVADDSLYSPLVQP